MTVFIGWFLAFFKGNIDTYKSWFNLGV